MGNGNGSTTFHGVNRRSHSDERRDHYCSRDEDFGVIKTNLKSLGNQVVSHIKEQKERNETFYEKLDSLNTCITKVSVFQETLPAKVVEILDAKSDKKIEQYGRVAKIIATVLSILAVLGTVAFWTFNFVSHNAVPIP